MSIALPTVVGTSPGASIRPVSLRRTRWLGTLALAVTALLAACGGGGDAVAPAAPAPGAPDITAAAFSQGPIAGFGSIIVGGVRWDDSAAGVFDDSGNSVSRSALQLGVMVEVEGSALDLGTSRGNALRVRLGSETRGPVSSVDAAGSSFVVLGMTVQVTSTTVFDDSLRGGLAGLAAGQVVEVHGLLNTTTNQIVATRVEAESSVTRYALRGVISALDAGARTFRIGSQLISYAGLANATPANGQVVKVTLQTTPVAGAWVATALRGPASRPGDSAHTHVEGLITAWTSAAVFSIGPVTVDASQARFPDGTAGVVLGARVEVEGRTANGVLVASKVEIDNGRGNGSRNGGGSSGRGFELHGAISALNTSARTFVVRSVTVSYAGSVEFKDGTVADLADGRPVEVKGVMSADRTRLDARRIDFE